MFIRCIIMLMVHTSIVAASALIPIILFFLCFKKQYFSIMTRKFF